MVLDATKRKEGLGVISLSVYQDSRGIKMDSTWLPVHVRSSTLKLRLRLHESDSLVFNQSSQAVGRTHGLHSILPTKVESLEEVIGPVRLSVHYAHFNYAVTFINTMQRRVQNRQFAAWPSLRFSRFFIDVAIHIPLPTQQGRQEIRQ